MDHPPPDLTPATPDHTLAVRAGQADVGQIDAAHERARAHMRDAFVGLLFCAQQGVVPDPEEVKRLHDQFFHDGNGPLKEAYPARTRTRGGGH